MHIGKWELSKSIVHRPCTLFARICTFVAHFCYNYNEYIYINIRWYLITYYIIELYWKKLNRKKVGCANIYILIMYSYPMCPSCLRYHSAPSAAFSAASFFFSRGSPINSNSSFCFPTICSRTLYTNLKHRVHVLLFRKLPFYTSKEEENFHFFSWIIWEETKKKKAERSKSWRNPMSKLKTYCFKWCGPVSLKQSKAGGFQCLAVHILLRQDLAFISEVAPEIWLY